MTEAANKTDSDDVEMGDADVETEGAWAKPVEPRTPGVGSSGLVAAPDTP